MTVIKYKDQRNEDQEIVATVSAQIVPIDFPNRDRFFVGFQRDRRYKPVKLAGFENKTLCDVAIHNLQKAIERKDEVFVLEGMEEDRDFGKIGG